MGPFVLDASVALKWFLPEQYSEYALRLKPASTNLHVPAFFFLEFTHVACKKQRRREVTAAEVIGMIGIMRSAALRRHEDAAILPRALELALQLNVGFYDCMYLALALELDCPFVTADRRLAHRVSGTEFAERILWIEQIPTSQ